MLNFCLKKLNIIHKFHVKTIFELNLKQEGLACIALQNLYKNQLMWPCCVKGNNVIKNICFEKINLIIRICN